jgi:3-hydroxyacyl-CoA dehydrogenase
MVLSQDEAGFIVNRILVPMLNEAVFVLGGGTANVADIDEACRLGLNHPMGPLQLADFIGLDTCRNHARVCQQHGRWQVSPGAVAGQICRGRVAGPQDRAWFL